MKSSSTRWVVPQAVIDLSHQELAADGALDREGIALWAGAHADGGDGVVRITHVVLLRGPGVVRGEGYISISAELLNEVTDALTEVGQGTYLLGQIHGHPPDSSTDLSWVDIAHGIRTPDFLSVVAPDFGMRPTSRLADCGVHVFEQPDGWRRMTGREVNARVEITNGHTHRPVVLMVGEA